MGILAKLIPIRDWLYLAAFVAMIIAGAWVYHDIKKKGYAECQAKVQRAIQQEQKVMSDNSYVLEGEKTKIRTIVKRIPTPEKLNVPNSHDCDWPAPAGRVYNGAIAKANAARKSGNSVP